MFGLIRASLYSFGLCLLFIAYNMNPETAEMKDFLRVLHAPLFWRLDLAVTCVLYALHLADSLTRTALTRSSVVVSSARLAHCTSSLGHKSDRP